MYQFDTVRRDNPNASFCLWDYTLEAGLERLAEWHGNEADLYSVTIRKRNAFGEWLEVNSDGTHIRKNERGNR